MKPNVRGFKGALVARALGGTRQGCQKRAGFSLAELKKCHKNAIRMPRAPNTIATKQITISTTKMVWDHLIALTQTGLGGKNPAEAAERLVAEGIRGLIERGILAPTHKAKKHQPQGK
jgi:hypothetical protein